MNTLSQASVPLSAARVISEVLGPAPVLTLVLVQAGIQQADMRGFWLALIAALFVAIGPYAAMVVMARAGKVSDRFVGRRSQRAPILLAVLGSLAVGLVLLVVLRAPASLVAMTIMSAVGLVVVMIVNLAWKLSIHSAIASCAWALQFAFLPAPVAILLVVLPIMVAGARVREGAHTVAQVVAGSAVGVLVAGAYPLLESVLSH